MVGVCHGKDFKAIKKPNDTLYGGVKDDLTEGEQTARK